MVIPLIPIDKIREAIDNIIETIPDDSDRNLLSFFKYFKKQWLNGSISAEIWNHRNSQKRTNNNLVGFHSKLT